MQVIATLKKAYKIIFRSGLTQDEAFSKTHGGISRFRRKCNISWISCALQSGE